MQGRPAGHQIDALAIIVGLEEQVNENAQRIDNSMRNLVELAGAVRSLVGKVESLQQKLEERHLIPDLMYPQEVHSETILEIQTEQSALQQRVDDLEKRGGGSATTDYAPMFQRTEAEIEALRLQLMQLQQKTALLEESPGGGGEASRLLEDLRGEISQVIKRQREQEAAVRDVQDLAPKITQRLTDIARKYPDGSIAKVEDIERLGGALEKLSKEQAKVDDRFKDFANLRDSSALLTILKTEHAALLRRIENLEAAGPATGDGEVPAIFDEVRGKLETLAEEQEALKEQLTSVAGQSGELPDIAPLIEEAVAPLRSQISHLASAPQAQAEVTRQIEAALAPLRSRLDQHSSTPHELPDVTPLVEEVVAPLRQQLSALESRAPSQSADSGQAIQRLETVLAGLGSDRDALLEQLAEQSKLIELQRAEVSKLHDAFDGVKKAAAESGKPSPELIEAAAASKHLQGAVEKLSKEHAGLREQIKGLSALEVRVAELADRPVADNTKDLDELRDAVRFLRSEQEKTIVTVERLNAQEIPRPVDYSQDFENLRQEIAALNALQQPLLERIAELEGRDLPELRDYAGDLSAIQGAIETIRAQHDPLMARLAELEARELPTFVDSSADVEELKAVLNSLAIQQTPLLARIAALEQRDVPAPADYSGELAELRTMIGQLGEQQSPLSARIAELESRPVVEPVADNSVEIAELRATIDVLAEQQAPLLGRLAELEKREMPQVSDYSGDIERLQSALDKLALESSQLDSKLSRFVDQSQMSKLMETLSELQMRLARNAEQLVVLEQSRNQGAEEQRKQLQNQLDIQERQRALLEELQVRLEVQQEQIAAQQQQLAELVTKAREASERRRRASDLPHTDPTMGPLIESALHIERGEYAEAVRCLEAALQLGDNPKIQQALELARQMLGQQKEQKA